MSKLEEEIISHVMDITFKWERIIQDTHEVCLEREMGGREGGRGGCGGELGGSAALCASYSASSPGCFRFVL